MKKCLSLIFIFLFLFLCSSAPGAQEAAREKVMIVLDASGSMWGQIDNEPKISIARRIIQDLLASWDNRIALGLCVYGHRQKSDCSDIEVLVPVGINNIQKILTAISKINPKGKTPLSDAVKLAAESLKYNEDRASVILISDGVETCDADPCLLGETLEKTGVDFTTHVIGFGLEGDDEKGLQCLAENTGGIYALARDAGSLKEALEKSVVEVKKKALEPVKPKETPESMIKLTALYAPDGPEYKGQINWWVLSKDKDLAGKRPVAAEQWRGRSGQVFKKIKPGDYIAVAELSEARYIRQEFEINVPESGSKEISLVLNIGTVRFDALMNSEGKPFEKDLGWYVLHPEKDLSGEHKKLTDFWRVKSGGVFILPAGEWLISGLFADAKYIRTSKKIKVEPASEHAHEFNFNAALVRFDAKLSPDSEAFKGDLGWYILDPEKDLSGSHKKLTDFWRQKSGAIFYIPAGEWLVQGVLADYKHIKTQQKITLKAGAERPFEFDFNAGKVKVSVTSGGQPYPRNVAWKIYLPEPDLAGNLTEVTDAWRVPAERITILNQGAYKIKALDPDDKSVQGEGEFDVRAGEEKSITIDIKKES